MFLICKILARVKAEKANEGSDKDLSDIKVVVCHLLYPLF